MPPGGGVPAEAYPAYVSANYIELMSGENPADYSGVDPNLPTRAYNPFNLMSTLKAAFASGNPYDAAFAFDPTELLADSQTNMEAAIAAAVALAPETDWETFTDAAIAKLADFLPTASNINTATDAYRDSVEPDYERALNEFAGGMAEINAVGGSAFAFGVAQIRARFESDVNRHRSQLETTFQREKTLFIVQAAGEMAKELQFKVGSMHSLAQLQGEINRVAIIAQKEWLEQELTQEVERIFWDPNLFKFGGQMVASIAGVATPERGMSRTSSVLSGAITGGSSLASLGAQAGAGPAVMLGIAGAFLGGYAGFATM